MGRLLVQLRERVGLLGRLIGVDEVGVGELHQLRYQALDFLVDGGVGLYGRAGALLRGRLEARLVHLALLPLAALLAGLQGNRVGGGVPQAHGADARRSRAWWLKLHFLRGRTRQCAGAPARHQPRQQCASHLCGTPLRRRAPKYAPHLPSPRGARGRGSMPPLLPCSALLAFPPAARARAREEEEEERRDGASFAASAAAPRARARRGNGRTSARAGCDAAAGAGASAVPKLYNHNDMGARRGLRSGGRADEGERAGLRTIRILASRGPIYQGRETV
eukprot:scaffold443_cov527-Prasinococcus_capsulatus_cf.AAC.30